MMNNKENCINKPQSLLDYNEANSNNKSMNLTDYSKSNSIKISIQYDNIKETSSSNHTKINNGNTPIQSNINEIHNYANNSNQWYSYGGINPEIINNQTSPYYGNFIPFNEISFKDSNYAIGAKLQSNQTLSRVPLNQITQYISFQNHFHCYPFPLFQYVPFYPNNFNPHTQKQTTPNDINQYQPQQDTTTTTANLNSETITQIELLFSFSSLNKDIYFRSSMDQNGWMPLNILMTIISIKRLHVQSDQIVKFLNHSNNKTVELKTNNQKCYYIRKINWEEFSKGLLNIKEIKRQKLNKPQNHYLCSNLKDTHVQNRKEFTGAF